MINDKKKEIFYYIINEKCTIKEAALKYNKSLSSIKKYIAELKQSKDNEDKKLYEKLKCQLLENESLGKKNGGKKGKATSKFTTEDAKFFAIYMIANDLTLSMASELSGIPKSTIHDFLTTKLGKDEENLLKDLKCFFDFHITYKNLLNLNHNNDFDNSRNYKQDISDIVRLKIDKLMYKYNVILNELYANKSISDYKNDNVKYREK